LKSCQELKIAIAETLSEKYVPETEVLLEEKFVFKGFTRSDTEPTIVEKMMSRNNQTLQNLEETYLAAIRDPRKT